MRVLYLYSGKRKIKKYKGKLGVDYPDTQFYGLNHLKKYGIEAEYQELGDFKYFKFLEKFLSFRVKHFLMFFKIKRYDLVFGSSLIYFMPLKIIFKNKTKFILFNFYLNRMFVFNKDSFLKFNIIKFLVKQLDGIICLTKNQKKCLMDNYGFPEDKIQIIALGTDIRFRQYVSDESRKNFILSTGSDPGKDYRTVLKTAELCPNLNFIIVCGAHNVAGISKKEIPDNVEILHRISFKKLRRLYYQAKIFLLVFYPDKDNKGTDASGLTVLLEAMSSGLPIVASSKAYLSDYAKNNQEIIITDSNNPREIKEKIELLLSDKNLRKNLAQNARKKIEKNFTSQLMAKKLAEYFKSLCD